MYFINISFLQNVCHSDPLPSLSWAAFLSHVCQHLVPWPVCIHLLPYASFRIVTIPIVLPSLAHHSSLKPFWKDPALDQLGFLLHTTVKAAEGCSLILDTECSLVVFLHGPI